MLSRIHRTFQDETQTGLLRSHLARPSNLMQMLIINARGSLLVAATEKSSMLHPRNTVASAPETAALQQLRRYFRKLLVLNI